MRSASALLTAAASLALTVSAQPPKYDLVIIGGRIVDGTGGPWYYGDLGIKGDSIAAIGKLDANSASQRIDARGMVVAPGFIDPHTHATRGIYDDPFALNYIRQGVTTIMEGPDGSSPLPIKEFLDRVTALRPAINFGTFVGQGSIREQVMGLVNRPATRDEVETMRGVTRQAMFDGAFGISTGLIYVPGTFTPTEELIELAKVAGLLGGMHTSHMRDEGARSLESVAETIRIGKEGDLPTNVTHHKIMGTANKGLSSQTLQLVEDARLQGVDVTLDAYPYTATSTRISALVSQWALEGGRPGLLDRLNTPAQRVRIKAEVVASIEGERGGGDPNNIVIGTCAFDHKLDGKNLSELTRERGKDITLPNAAETAMEILESGDCQAIYHVIDESDIERILRYPFTMICSDGEVAHFEIGVPHPRSYGTFARVLGRYVRERKTLTLEDAVHRMSGLTAARMKLFDRGLLRPGMKADVVIFDPDSVADKADYANPHQYAVGFREVIVNGTLIILQGALTMERPGHVIYGPAKH